MTDKQLAEIVYADPAKMTPNTKALPESELMLMARSREATGRYAWTPYMHNPKLRQRLHRVRIPTSVLWGEADRLVKPDYGRALAAAIPGARFATSEPQAISPTSNNPTPSCAAFLNSCRRPPDESLPIHGTTLSGRVERP
jgi:pimeloyl-ACP methyl ester carboxylesterase